MNPKRFRVLKDGALGPTGPVVYWMSRDQRLADNWALIHAQEQALRAAVPLRILFCLAPSFLDATMRQYRFMMDGLKEIESRAGLFNIPFQVVSGQPDEVLPRLLAQLDASLLITDFDPLRIKRDWTRRVADRIQIPFHQVDARNIVPVWVASGKQEFSARTFRPKVRRLLAEFLEPFPALIRHPFGGPEPAAPTDWNRLEKGLRVDRSVGEVTWLTPGEKAGASSAARFIDRGLSLYGRLRNDPSAHGRSDLSPYLHFGQLSSQRLALGVVGADAPVEAKEAFLEELIVRRELADNYCFYNTSYDRLEGFPLWAAKTLEEHLADPRPVLYELRELEEGRTGDGIWNAAQTEMVRRGKMDGYLRMYWAKKLLEWTPSPSEAQRIAVYLNDRYEIDGRDPNGYAGIAWSIGGVHDRPWPARPVFGKVRYMSGKALEKKFDAKAYVAWVASL